MLYAKIAVGIVLAALAAWIFRVNDLRAQHVGTIDSVVKVLHEGGLEGSNRKNVAAATGTLKNQRDQARNERDQARTVVDSQSRSIEALNAETQEYLKNAAAQQRLIETTTKQRDMWIKRARSASSRTERLSAEEEVAQCEQVLDELYQSDF